MAKPPGPASHAAKSTPMFPPPPDDDDISDVEREVIRDEVTATIEGALRRIVAINERKGTGDPRLYNEPHILRVQLTSDWRLVASFPPGVKVVTLFNSSESQRVHYAYKEAPGTHYNEIDTEERIPLYGVPATGIYAKRSSGASSPDLIIEYWN